MQYLSLEISCHLRSKETVSLCLNTNCTHMQSKKSVNQGPVVKTPINPVLAKPKNENENVKATLEKSYHFEIEHGFLGGVTIGNLYRYRYIYISAHKL